VLSTCVLSLLDVLLRIITHYARRQATNRQISWHIMLQLLLVMSRSELWYLHCPAGEEGVSGDRAERAPGRLLPPQHVCQLRGHRRRREGALTLTLTLTLTRTRTRTRTLTLIPRMTPILRTS